MGVHWSLGARVRRGQGVRGGCYEDLPLLCVKRTSEAVQSIGEEFVLINWSFRYSESAGA